MRIIYITGKGGTGKTVISAITALKSSQYGYNTLIISSDPAHTLKDCFGIEVGREYTKIAKDLYGLAIDPVKEASEHYGAIMEYIASIFRARGIDEILAYELAALPGMTGVATMLKLDMIIKEDSFDTIIIDTVPSGDALRYLYVPTLLSRMSRRMMKLISPIVEMGRVMTPITGVPTPTKESVEKGIEIIEKMENIRKYLLDSNITSLRLVANPDSFSISNVKRTYIQSSLYGLNTDLIIINKLYPKEGVGEFFKDWLINQTRLIEDVNKTFHPIPIKMLRLYNSELKGIDMLTRAGDDLFGDEDPTQIYYKGRTVEINRYGDRLEVIYPAPHITKKDIEIERIGDELLVKLSTDMGIVDLVLPLPLITYKMKVEKARLINGKLHIIFVEEK
ncbi:TPA: ArsA family ATPase [Candidatus Geothermarchaeota archaeon]|nr:ArsA family ATPase [Candidatus Geothermarchaeota archaeon]HIQ13094.1 ArsA family ATPase [Thermoprotei archaeon]